jgi:polyisoprenoid-binding protein YceI
MSTAVNPLTAISTWSVDPAHSSVHFKVRYMMISNVRGEFRTVRCDLKLVSRSAVTGHELRKR